MAIFKNMKNDTSGTTKIKNETSKDYVPTKRKESLGSLSGHTGDNKLFTLMYSLDLTGSMCQDNRYVTECQLLVEHLKGLNDFGFRCRVGVRYLKNNSYNCFLEMADLTSDYIDQLERILKNITAEGQTALTHGIQEGDRIVIEDVEKSINQGFYCNTPVHIFFSDFQSTESEGMVRVNLDAIFSKEDNFEVIHVYAITDNAEAKLFGIPVSRKNFVMNFTETSNMKQFFSFISQSVKIASTSNMEVDYSDRRSVGLHVQQGISDSFRIHHDDI